MRRRELACISFEVMVLCDQSCACGSRVCKDIGIGAPTQSDIISVFYLIARVAKSLSETCREVLIDQKAPVRR